MAGKASAVSMIQVEMCDGGEKEKEGEPKPVSMRFTRLSRCSCVNSGMGMERRASEKRMRRKARETGDFGGERRVGKAAVC